MKNAPGDTSVKHPVEASVRLVILCSPMPASDFGNIEDVQLGIQHGQEVRDGVREADGSMRFEVEVRVRQEPTTGRPNFLGPWVHGPIGGRFVYLTWTGWEDGQLVRFRRMKIPLSSIAWEQVQKATAQEDRALTCLVSGIDARGAPACATVPLEGDSWQVKSLSAFAESADR